MDLAAVEAAGLAAVDWVELAAGFDAAGGVEVEFAAGDCWAGALAARKSPAATMDVAINLVLGIDNHCGIPGLWRQIECRLDVALDVTRALRGAWLQWQRKFRRPRR